MSDLGLIAVGWRGTVLHGESHEGEECGNAPLMYGGPVARVVMVAFGVEGDEGFFGGLGLLYSHDAFEEGLPSAVGVM